ncbi:hypothetical protein CXG81DRAFT_21453 [Caulochytrium protostelioides]|uniref:Uncharacterized protein n=1 Tax=Caulochytrium protostelioides TaxID=1555241 RepID=A0A4V1ITU7_9FUNG|nr:hypothetical protein CXG81DRAFT_21453 [Caulochytrium protostelioides]|eukprot:RKO98297.1 hypothetical protein CXG81DRAFT_21453 [Caulochytrium protostelioides]
MPPKRGPSPSPLRPTTTPESLTSWSGRLRNRSTPDANDTEASVIEASRDAPEPHDVLNVRSQVQPATPPLPTAASPAAVVGETAPAPDPGVLRRKQEREYFRHHGRCDAVCIKGALLRLRSGHPLDAGGPLESVVEIAGRQIVADALHLRHNWDWFWAYVRRHVSRQYQLAKQLLKSIQRAYDANSMREAALRYLRALTGATYPSHPSRPAQRRMLEYEHRVAVALREGVAEQDAHRLATISEWLTTSNRNACFTVSQRFIKLFERSSYRFDHANNVPNEQKQAETADTAENAPQTS